MPTAPGKFGGLKRYETVKVSCDALMRIKLFMKEQDEHNTEAAIKRLRIMCFLRDIFIEN